MCVPQLPSPSYILAAPKPAWADSLFQFHPYEERTYGDYLGVSGVLRVFAAVFGENHVPELLTASRVSPDLGERDANLFLIGSHKTNPFVKRMLASLAQPGAPNWQSHAAPGEEDKEQRGEDFEVQFSGELEGETFSTPRAPRDPQQHREDYGLIMRGPHPLHPHRTVMILAGPHSLGTGAACLAATTSKLVREIHQRLASMIDPTRRDRTIWVLVKGVADNNRHINPDGVTIERAGVYPEPTEKK